MAQSTRRQFQTIDPRLAKTMSLGAPEVAPADMPSVHADVIPGLDRPQLTQPAITSPQRAGSSQTARTQSGPAAAAGDSTLPPPTAEYRRHQVGDLLGIGTTGEVFSITDGNLERTVAVKIIPSQDRGDREAIAHLVAEARITASLAHPNVLPVYDLDLDDSGRAYFSMKKIEGRSLGDVLQQSTLQARDGLIANDHAVVTIFIGIAQALAYAHRRGIVHQDIKPDNIMLGEYGEVLVVDWGSAERLRPGVVPRLYGTPIYMSPEQARSESVDERSDVYCLGATLLHVLLLRLPTWDDHVDEFWRKKRRGELDPVSHAERRQSSAALLSITSKALAASPADRYPHAGALLADLQAFQAGLRVSAHQDSVREVLARWYRHHGRRMWTTLLVASIVCTLLGILYAERIQEQVSWGSPVVSEDFTSDAWRASWIPAAGSFTREGDRLVSGQDFENIVYLDRTFTGPTAIEYDAVMTPGHPAGDISVVWAPTLTFSADHARVIASPTVYNFQVGGYDNAYTVISVDKSDCPDKQKLCYSGFHPVIGQTCHVRAEITDTHLQLWVDGVLICSGTEPFPLTSGYLGLYAFYPGKAFSHVRISSRGLPQKIKATAIGDFCVQMGNLAEAVDQYAGVARAHPHTAVGDEATYKQGLCDYQLKRTDLAFATWQLLRGSSTYEPLIHVQEIDREVQDGRPLRAMDAMRAFAPTASGATRTLLAQQWSRYAFSQLKAPDKTLLQRWLDIHDQLFMQEHAQDSVAAEALLALGKNQEVLVRYPEQRPSCAEALVATKQMERIVREYPEQVFPISLAAFYLGLSDIGPFRHFRFIYGIMLLNEGRCREARDQATGLPPVIAASYAAEGRIDEAITVPDLDLGDRIMLLLNAQRWDQIPPSHHFLAELAQGRPSEVLAQQGYPTHPEDLLALRAMIHGQAPPAGAFALSRWTMENEDWSGFSFDAIAVPFMQDLQGGHDQLMQSCQRLLSDHRWWNRQRAYVQASYLLGRITRDAYLVHPWRLYAPAELALLDGMRAERRGDTATALGCYRTWMGMPSWRRDCFPNPVWAEFAAWRVSVLSLGSSPVPAQGAPTGNRAGK